MSSSAGRVAKPRKSLKTIVPGAGATANADEIMAVVRQYGDRQRKSKPAKALTLRDLGLDTVGNEVSEKSDEEVSHLIESLVLKTVSSILADQGLTYAVPSRSSGNQLYVPELDRIVLKSNSSDRGMTNVSTVRKTAITTRIVQLVHEVRDALLPDAHGHLT